MSDSDDEMRAIYFTDEQYSHIEKLAKECGVTEQELLTSLLEGLLNSLEGSEKTMQEAITAYRRQRANEKYLGTGLLELSENHFNNKKA